MLVVYFQQNEAIFTFELENDIYLVGGVESESLPPLVAGGPSPSSAIKLRYSSSILACELAETAGGPPWPGRFALQS